MMMRAESQGLRDWVIAARPMGHGMIALPLLWGQAMALLVTQQFDWLWLVVIQVFGVLCQVCALYLNDYADEALDRLNSSFWLSGGSRVIPNGQLSGQQLYAASLAAMLTLILLAGIVFALGRLWMPVVTLVAIGLAWSYSLAPLRASYRGLGELHQALSCGAFLPLVAFYLQAGTLTGFPWWLLLPVCLIFYAGNIVTALPDITSDRQGGKQTYPVRHGDVRARRDALIVLLLAYVILAIVSVQLIDWQVMTALVSAPAVALLFYIYQTGLVERAGIENRALCIRYILLMTVSQVWVMVLWTTLIFWRGLQIA